MAKPVANPKVLSDVEAGRRVQLASGSVLWVTRQAGDGVWARRVEGSKEGPLRYYAGDIAVARVLS